MHSVSHQSGAFYQSSEWCIPSVNTVVHSVSHQSGAFYQSSEWCIPSVNTVVHSVSHHSTASRHWSWRLCGEQHVRVNWWQAHREQVTTKTGQEKIRRRRQISHTLQLEVALMVIGRSLQIHFALRWLGMATGYDALYHTMRQTALKALAPAVLVT